MKKRKTNSGEESFGPNVLYSEKKMYFLVVFNSVCLFRLSQKGQNMSTPLPTLSEKIKLA